MEGYRAQPKPMSPDEWMAKRRSAALWEVHRERDLWALEAERLSRQLAGAVDALRKIHALLEADMNRGAFMVRLEQITADALSLYGGR